jgi:4'-phosphopantetheinyl transferase
MQLARDEVHCWCLRLDVSAATRAALSATLSPDERHRAAHLASPQLQQRFIAARGGLRELLARYLGAHPGALQFVYNEYGKPALSAYSGGRIRFNLSHSDDLALIGVAAEADLGVDVERVREQPYFAEIARSFFGAAEAESLGKLAGEARTREFLKSWTRKEAYAKAQGTGLGALAQDAAAVDWSLYSLQPAPGYVGALVIQGNSWRVSQRVASLDAFATPALSQSVLSCC